MTEDLQQNYAGVWGTRVGFGTRPALLMIDFVKGYTTPGAPLFAQGVVEAVAQAKTLLAAARAAGVLVVHTKVSYQPQTLIDGGVWMKKAPVLASLAEGHPHGAFCDGVEPAKNELVVVKQYASAFFGSSLSSTLHAAGIDTVVLAGCTTSGCIRASAVDAVQNGFRTIVPRDCVGDRHAAPHEANLFDIDSKYGDVCAMEDVLVNFRNLQGSNTR